MFRGREMARTLERKRQGSSFKIQLCIKMDRPWNLRKLVIHPIRDGIGLKTSINILLTNCKELKRAVVWFTRLRNSILS